MMKATGNWATNQILSCAATIDDVDIDPAYRNTLIRASPIAISGEITWADERNAPSSGYVEPDDHPPSTIPYTPTAATASMKSTATGRSVSCSGVSRWVNGIR